MKRHATAIANESHNKWSNILRRQRIYNYKQKIGIELRLNGNKVIKQSINIHEREEILRKVEIN